MNIKHTFFDSLMLADSERIHSQMIDWIIRDEAKLFLPGERNLFIKNLFDQNLEIHDDKFSVLTEHSRADIAIKINDSDFVVIENKLKTSEHSDQTDRYSELFDFDKSINVLYFFLSLVGDKANNINWKPITYRHLLNQLKLVNFDQSKKEIVFVEEYIQTLENLVLVFEEFEANHTLFPNVFLDGSKTKSQKSSYSDEFQDYIRRNQLETILQKYFWKKVASKLENKFNLKVSINETRGVALIDVVMHDTGIYENFNLVLQVQGNSIKRALIHKAYGQSVKEMLSVEMANSFLNRMVNDGFSRKNHGTSKAYLSVSKKMPILIFNSSVESVVDLVLHEVDAFSARLTS